MVDAVVQKRNRANRSRGARFETDFLKGIRTVYPDSERLTKTGAKDQGDVAVIDDEYRIVVECKTGKLNVTDFLRQAAVERENYLAQRPHLDPRKVEAVVVWKVPGKNWSESVVLTTVKEYFDLDHKEKA